MSEKEINNKKIIGFIKLQVINFTISFFVMFIMCAISISSDISKEHIHFVSLAFISVCSFVSGFTAGIKERKNGMLKGIIYGLPFNIVIIIISLIMNNFNADLNLLFAVLTGLLFSAIGGIVAVNIRLKR